MEIVNKEAYRKYEVLEEFEAGIVLTGSEVKSLKNARLSMKGSYVKFISHELFWINASIPLYAFATNEDYEPERSRKLLLSRKQLIRLETKLKERQNLTIVPLKCYTAHRLLKLKIALSKGKKTHDIKALEKKRDVVRNEKREAKEYLK